MTTAGGLAFVAVIVGFVTAVLLYRRHRVRSFARALAALGGRPTRPGPLPEALDWAGTEILAARAIELLPGVPATFVALMRSAAPAASADLGTAKADPFLVLRVPTEAVRDRAAFRAALAASLALEEVFADDTGHLVVAARAPHSGAAVEATVAAVRGALAPAPRFVGAPAQRLGAADS